MITIKADRLQDGLYQIQDRQIRKYKAGGGTVRTYEMGEVDRPTGKWMSFEEVATMLADMFGECACDVNGVDEWLPQFCKYADTECPEPKEKNGCWMQFLMQGGADMRGDTEQ